MSHYEQGQTLYGGHSGHSRISGSQYHKALDTARGIRPWVSPATKSSHRCQEEEHNQWTRDIGPETIGAKRLLRPIVRTSHEPPTFRRGMPRN